MKICVLVSGRGSNLAALLEELAKSTTRARVVRVVSDNPNAGALELAKSHRIPTSIVPFRSLADRPGWNHQLHEAVAQEDPDLVVLGGFMKVIAEPLLSRFHRRMINVHPSLLPSFPGAHGPRDALRAGVKISGCTVHYVDSGVDTGSILAQAAVPVVHGDTPETLHLRIQRAEHALLPAVVIDLARRHEGNLSESIVNPDAESTSRILFCPPLVPDGSSAPNSPFVPA